MSKTFAVDFWQKISSLLTLLMFLTRFVMVTGITVKRGEILHDKDYRLCLNQSHYRGGLSGYVITASSKSPKLRAVFILLKCNVFRFHFEALSSY